MSDESTGFWIVFGMPLVFILYVCISDLKHSWFPTQEEIQTKKQQEYLEPRCVKICAPNGFYYVNANKCVCNMNIKIVDPNDPYGFKDLIK